MSQQTRFSHSTKQHWRRNGLEGWGSEAGCHVNKADRVLTSVEELKMW